MTPLVSQHVVSDWLSPYKNQRYLPFTNPIYFVVVSLYCVPLRIEEINAAELLISKGFA